MGFEPGQQDQTVAPETEPLAKPTDRYAALLHSTHGSSSIQTVCGVEGVNVAVAQQSM